MERQVIRRDRWLHRGENKNLAAWTNFKDRAAAVANVQIAVGIKRQPSRDAHAFDPLLSAAFGRDAMNRTVTAAGDEKIPHAVECQPAGIDQRSDERLYTI